MPTGRKPPTQTSKPPFTDHHIVELEEQFSEISLKPSSLLCLVPSVICEAEVKLVLLKSSPVLLKRLALTRLGGGRARKVGTQVLDFVVSTYELYSSHVMDSISPEVPLAHGKLIVFKTRVPPTGEVTVRM